MTGRQNDLRILPQTKEQKFIEKTLYFYQMKKASRNFVRNTFEYRTAPQRPAGFIGHRQEILPKKLCKTNRTFSRNYSSAGLRKPIHTPVPPYFSERSRSDGFPPPRSFPPAGLAGSFPGRHSARSRRQNFCFSVFHQSQRPSGAKGLTPRRANSFLNESDTLRCFCLG